MAKWAKDHPTDFYRLYGRLLPLEHVGKDGKELLWPLPQHPLEQSST
jgi:hypothetical protein